MERYIKNYCPICDEEMQEDTTIYVDRAGKVVGCDWCMNIFNANEEFDFWEDEEEELYRAADIANDIERCGY